MRLLRRVVIHRPGGYDALRIEHAPLRTPRAGEVRLAVHACGVNYADCVVRMGLYAPAKKYVGWPITPGFEVAGVVDAVGPGVDLEIGERVLAVTRFGGYATSLVVRQSQVFRLPEGWSFAQGATMPTVFLTAWYGLHRVARAESGERILVHSAAGGVGTALVQLAHRAGLEVVGVVGAAHKREHVLRLGASVIDKSAEDLWRRAEELAPGGFDAIFDANGVSTLRGSYAHLAPGGRVVVYGFHSMLPRAGARTRGLVDWPRLALAWLRTPRFDPLDLTGDNRGAHGFNLAYLFEREALLREAMGTLLDGFAAGQLEPPPVTEVSFDDVAQAQRALEGGGTIGKLALTVPSTPLRIP